MSAFLVRWVARKIFIGALFGDDDKPNINLIFKIKWIGREKIPNTLNRLQRNIDRAKTLALNRTATELRTRVVRMLNERTGYQQKLIRERFVLTRATRGTLTARLRITGKAIPLIKLPSKQTPAGVVVMTGKGSLHFPSGFIATMPSGHRGVYMRKRRQRLPIKEMYGPSLQREFAALFSELRPIAIELFHKNFQHEMSRLSK